MSDENKEMELPEKDEDELGSQSQESQKPIISSSNPIILLDFKIEIPRKNKLFCASIFFNHLILTLVYLIGLIVLHVLDIQTVQLFQVVSTFSIFYGLFLLDMTACGIGVWTCLAKTGAWPMLGACLTLILTSLVNMILPIEFYTGGTMGTEESQHGTPTKLEDCKRFTKSPECISLKRITLIFWGTYALIILKIILIIICRCNYPHVFNWTHAHEEAIRVNQGSSSMLMAGSIVSGHMIREVHSQTIAPGMFFAPVDLNRMSLRGSLAEGEVYKSARHGSIFYPRKSTLGLDSSGRASISVSEAGFSESSVLPEDSEKKPGDGSDKKA